MTPPINLCPSCVWEKVETLSRARKWITIYKTTVHQTRLKLPSSSYLIVLPLIGVLVLVEFYPVAYSAYLSVLSNNGDFVGLSNYLQMISDRAFLNSVGVSLLYSSGSTILAFAIGLLMAYLLSQKMRGR